MKLTKKMPYFTKELELNFRKGKVGFHRTSLLLLTMTIVSQASSIFFGNPLHLNLNENFTLAGFCLVIFLLISFSLLVVLRFPSLSSKAITIIVISFIIGGSEITKSLLERSFKTAGFYFVLGASLQTGCFFLIISNIHWGQNVISLIFTQVYIWTRSLDFENHQETQKPSMVTMVVYLIIFSYFCYSRELSEKEDFLKNHALETHLRLFENLIRNLIPSSILIFSKEKIKFFNKRTRFLLPISNDHEALKILKKIMVSKKIINLTPFINYLRNDYNIYLYHFFLRKFKNFFIPYT